MLFSIVVPIYNVEAYIDRCVKSLINQTFSEIEIILVDDESPDNCPTICDNYAKLDNRIKVIHKKNGGLSDARNKGLEIAKGQYVLFVDSDDYIELDTCERFSVFAEKNYDVLIGDAIVENGNKISHITASNEVYLGVEYFKKALFERKVPMAAWLNVYKRSFLINNKLQFKYGILHEDEQFTPRVFLSAQTVLCTGISFYHYVIRENSITTQKDKRKNAKDLFETCCELEKIYQGITDFNFQKRLLDTLVEKYLNIFQEARLYRYGRIYIHGDFLKRNSFRLSTRIKVLLMLISPKIYFIVNRMQKKLVRKGRKI